MNQNIGIGRTIFHCFFLFKVLVFLKLNLKSKILDIFAENFSVNCGALLNESAESEADADFFQRFSASHEAAAYCQRSR